MMKLFIVHNPIIRVAVAVIMIEREVEKIEGKIQK